MSAVRPLKSIRKWTRDRLVPFSRHQATTMVTPAVTVAPVESVADTHT